MSKVLPSSRDIELPSIIALQSDLTPCRLSQATWEVIGKVYVRGEMLLVIRSNPFGPSYYAREDGTHQPEWLDA